jgi:hypothetical protein
VRQGPWKLVGKGGNTTTLVNVEQDIAEKDNRIKEQPELVAELLKLHLQWLDLVGRQ